MTYSVRDKVRLMLFECRLYGANLPVAFFQI